VFTADIVNKSPLLQDWRFTIIRKSLPSVSLFSLVMMSQGQVFFEAADKLRSLLYSSMLKITCRTAPPLIKAEQSSSPCWLRSFSFAPLFSPCARCPINLHTYPSFYAHRSENTADCRDDISMTNKIPSLFRRFRSCLQRCPTPQAFYRSSTVRLGPNTHISFLPLTTSLTMCHMQLRAIVSVLRAPQSHLDLQSRGWASPPL
jgi:hypothetical protein